MIALARGQVLLGSRGKLLMVSIKTFPNLGMFCLETFDLQTVKGQSKLYLEMRTDSLLASITYGEAVPQGISGSNCPEFSDSFPSSDLLSAALLGVPKLFSLLFCLLEKPFG